MVYSVGMIQKSLNLAGNMNHFQKTSHCLALKMSGENIKFYQNDLSGRTYPVPPQANFKKFFRRCHLCHLGVRSLTRQQRLRPAYWEKPARDTAEPASPDALASHFWFSGACNETKSHAVIFQFH